MTRASDFELLSESVPASQRFHCREPIADAATMLYARTVILVPLDVKRSGYAVISRAVQCESVLIIGSVTQLKNLYSDVHLLVTLLHHNLCRLLNRSQLLN